MNTGQTLLTICALALLSLAIFNVNKMLIHSDYTLAENRYRLEALSLLTSYIEQASQHYFDEASTDTTTGKTINDFVLPAQLGFDGNDYGVIDDFDDFHGYTKVDTGRSGVVYKNYFQVKYVKLQGNQIVNSSNREYHKRMTIFITDNYNPPLLYKYVNGVQERDTLKMSFVYSYWFYN